MTDTDRTIACVIYDGLTPLDLIGPLQVFTTLRTIQGFTGAPQHRVEVVGGRIEPLSTDTGIRMIPTATFADVPDPDVLLVPGGGVPTLRAMVDPTLIAYVRKAAATAELVTSVCTGALILAAAGLLDGRPATTHWGYHRLLDRLGSQYVPDRWVDAGDGIITAAGVSAGIDVGLHVVELLAGPEMARAVQLGIEYDPHPPFGGIDWSRVDRDQYAPFLQWALQEALEDHPEMLQRLTADQVLR